MLAAEACAIAAPARVIELVVFALVLRSGVRPDRAALAIARILAALIVLERRGMRAAARALAQGDVRGLAALDPALAMQVATASSRADAKALWSLAASAHEAVQRPVQPMGADAAVLPAPFGGLVVLLEEIDALLSAAFVAALPRLGDAWNARGAAALLVLALASGRSAAAGVWRDPSWRSALGVPPSLTLDDFTGALAEAGDEAAMRARDALGVAAAQHVRGTVIATALRVRSERLRLEVDSATRIWCRIARRQTFDDEVSNSSFVDRLAAARHARRDWDDLIGDNEIDLPTEWRIVFVACAQIAWRRLAYRVPGMAGSSLPYLRRNLASARGELVRSPPDRVRWSLSRPPLHVLLGIAGLARKTGRWSGPPEQQLEWEMA